MGGRQFIGEVKRGKIVGEGEKNMIDTEKVAQGWRELSAEIVTGMAEWRQQHPKASLREIERALDERMGRLRAKMLEEAALLSDVRTWKGGEGKVPQCPDCGEALESRTQGKRELQTHGGETISLERQYGVCPKCGQGFFPPG